MEGHSSNYHSTIDDAKWIFHDIQNKILKSVFFPGQNLWQDDLTSFSIAPAQEITYFGQIYDMMIWRISINFKFSNRLDLNWSSNILHDIQKKILKFIFSWSKFMTRQFDKFFDRGAEFEVDQYVFIRFWYLYVY